jgi:hypothetical protein
MKITASQAKAITQDWLNHFPGLGRYKTLHLLRRCGPVLVGICLNRASSGDIYKPTFHTHCLLRKAPAISLSLAVQLRSSNGSDAAITTKLHEARLPNSAAKMKDLALLPMVGDIRFADYERASARWTDDQQTPYWPTVIEDVVLLRAWAGVDYSSALDDAEKMLQVWPAFVTDKIGGVAGWLTRVEKAAGNRDKLATTLEGEVATHKLAPLPAGRFIA